MMEGDINIDLSQFHGIFFDESSEGIEVMESELLNLDIGDPDLEVINTIFRAAHSIKGSAGTFGFIEIADFTHVMETVLDHLRDGRLVFSESIKTLLLQSVDCLTGMIQASKDGAEHDQSTIADLQARLAALTEAGSGEAAAPVQPEVSGAAEDEDANTQDGVEGGDEAVEGTQTKGVAWHISFHPHENLFFTGNDPYRLIRELKKLGRLEVLLDPSRLPGVQEIDAENCYLGWEMTLYGDVTLNEINEIFAWVEGDCDLEISLDEDKRRTPDRRADSGQTGGRRKSDKQGVRRETATSIRVSTDKVDELLNLVGEMVITQSILSRLCDDMNMQTSERFSECLAQLERNTRDLQEQTMSIRMLPIDFAFQRLPRMVHDLSQTLGKKVELNISGEATELDKTVLEKIGDPLIHLVRNSLDHGIEPPEVRTTEGKSEVGRIDVSAHHIGGSIMIEIEDDGAGIDPEKIERIAQEKQLISATDNLSDHELMNLIFKPGFSTSADITDVSGRGVGMDVVKRNITDLGGTVELESRKGHGSKFTIRLPLTLAILDGQMVSVGQQVFIIPLHSIVETVQLTDRNLSSIADKDELYHYRDEYIRVIDLKDVFNIVITGEESDNHLLVIVDIGGRHVGFNVDNVVGQQQVVIKSLESNFKQVPGITGATVLGDGSVALILDVLGLSRYANGIADRSVPSRSKSTTKEIVVEEPVEGEEG